MIPKVSRPTAAKLRPIALTDITYKMIMTLIGQKVDQHITNNSRKKETQASFTKGCRIEDNLFLLQYCIQHCLTYKFPLVI